MWEAGVCALVLHGRALKTLFAASDVRAGETGYALHRQPLPAPGIETLTRTEPAIMLPIGWIIATATQAGTVPATFQSHIARVLVVRDSSYQVAERLTTAAYRNVIPGLDPGDDG